MVVVSFYYYICANGKCSLHWLWYYIRLKIVMKKIYLVIAFMLVAVAGALAQNRNVAKKLFNEGNFVEAKPMFESLLTIPYHTELTVEQQVFVVDSIRKAVRAVWEE